MVPTIFGRFWFSLNRAVRLTIILSRPLTILPYREVEGTVNKIAVWRGGLNQLKRTYGYIFDELLFDIANRKELRW